jgi:hypothetical protein
LREASDIFRYPPVVARSLGSRKDTLELLHAFRAELATLYPVLLEAAKIDPAHLYPQTVFLNIRSGFWWASSTQQYLDDVKRWLELSLPQDPFIWHGSFYAVSSFQFDKCPLWPDEEENTRRYLAFQKELIAHSHPLMRGCAHRSFAHYYAWLDEARALAHYQAFIETFVNEIIPTVPEWGHEMAFWDLNLPEPLQKAAGLRYITLSHARIIQKILECCPRFHMGIWRDPVLSCYEDLERIGEARQAVALLTACRNKLRRQPSPRASDMAAIDSWLRALKERHPDLTIDINLLPTRECAPRVMLNASDLSDTFTKQAMPPTSTCFRKLLIDENTIAIVCVWDMPGQAQCGVVRLDPATLAVRSCQAYSVPVKFSLGNDSNLHSWYFDHGPASAVRDDTICIAFPNGGIVVFPEGGSPRLLSEENGLPSNMVRAMDVMNERLYAVTGWLDSNGLIEFDLKANQAKELISPQDRPGGHPLDGRRISDVAADRRANCLWLAVEPNKNTGPVHVYCLSPQDAKAIPQASVRPSALASLERQGRYLGIVTYTEFYMMDLTVGRIALSARHGSWDPSTDDGAPWQTNMHLSSKAAGNSRVLISTARDQGGRDHTLWFSAGQRNPVEVTGPSFPPVHDIRDMGRVSRGVLILTPQSLSLIPGTAEDGS